MEGLGELRAVGALGCAGGADLAGAGGIVQTPADVAVACPEVRPGSAGGMTPGPAPLPNSWSHPRGLCWSRKVPAVESPYSHRGAWTHIWGDQTHRRGSDPGGGGSNPERLSLAAGVSSPEGLSPTGAVSNPPRGSAPGGCIKP